MIPAGIVDSEWPRIKRRLSDMAITYDVWQENLAEVTLGLDANGKYAATVGGVALSIPRQVGKTFTIGSLIVALCVEFPNLLVLWTAHHGRTITKTFESLQAMVKRKRIAPHLLPTSNKGIRTSHGEQEIRFANGSAIMFGAREQGFGRGFDAVDVEVFDEAQILSDKALEDMIAATNQARHEHGALLIYMGTPPRPEDRGEAFTSKRRQALSGDVENMVYVECSADPAADPDDREQWAKANPSYPHHTPVESMLRMRQNLPSVESWMLEAYGIWDEVEEVQRVIPSDIWAALEAGNEAPAQDAPPSALAVDMSHDRVLSIAGAWRDEDVYHVEILALDKVHDTSAAEDWIVRRAGRKIPVIIDEYSPAASMIANLKARKVKVITARANDMAKACGGFFDDATQGRLTHADQEQLNAAVGGAKKRLIGGAGGWGWDRKDPAINIAPLVSATLARFGAVITKKRERSGEAVFR